MTNQDRPAIGPGGTIAFGGLTLTVDGWAVSCGMSRNEFLLALRSGTSMIELFRVIPRPGRPPSPGTLRGRVRELELRTARAWSSPCCKPPRPVYFDGERSHDLRDRVGQLMQDIRALDFGVGDDGKKWDFYAWLPRGSRLADKLAFCEERMENIERCSGLCG
jgi:hypothetical protein